MDEVAALPIPTDPAMLEYSKQQQEQPREYYELDFGEIPDFQESPLYKWQLQEATDAARKRQIAQGLGNSTYGDRELSRIEQGLAAEDRERWIRDQMNLINVGMGYSAQIPQQSVSYNPFQSNLSTNVGSLQGYSPTSLSNLYMQQGGNLASGQQALGELQAQSALNQGNILSQAGMAQANVSPWWNNALSTLGTLKDLGIWSN
jgi:hypothetical protein